MVPDHSLLKGARKRIRKGISSWSRCSSREDIGKRTKKGVKKGIKKGIRKGNSATHIARERR